MNGVAPVDVISQRGFMAQAFPIVANTDIVNGTLGAYATDEDIINISDNFTFAIVRAAISIGTNTQKTSIKTYCGLFIFIFSILRN